MADLQELVASAKKKLACGDALYRADAARKAVNGVGIFFKPDVERLVKAILVRLPYHSRRRVA